MELLASAFLSVVLAGTSYFHTEGAQGKKSGSLIDQKL